MVSAPSPSDLRVVVERSEVEVGNRAHALAARTHAAQVDGVLDHALLDPAACFLGAHHAAGLPRRDVEGERRGRSDVRRAQPAEEDAEHGVGVGGGAHRGAGVRAHPLLVDDDRRRQSLKVVDVGPRQVGHESLHKGAVGLVDHPLRLGGDGGEHQRALARAGDAREHRQAALRDLDADVLEVVLARALHADQIVAVRDVQRGRLRVRTRGHAHRVSICERAAIAGLRRRGLALSTASGGALAASAVLKQPEDVAVGVGDGGHQAAATDVVRGLLHGGARGGHLGQLRLDVRHVPVGHR